MGYRLCMRSFVGVCGGGGWGGGGGGGGTVMGRDRAVGTVDCAGLTPLRFACPKALR